MYLILKRLQNTMESTDLFWGPIVVKTSSKSSCYTSGESLIVICMHTLLQWYKQVIFFHIKWRTCEIGKFLKHNKSNTLNKAYNVIALVLPIAKTMYHRIFVALTNTVKKILVTYWTSMQKSRIVFGRYFRIVLHFSYSIFFFFSML